jgi:phosphocarrier protein
MAARRRGLEHAMLTRTVLISNALGMHARAAARFVHAATAYQSHVRVARDGRTVDGKSIMGLLLLAAPRGTRLEISADGPDEAAAIETLCSLVTGGLGEEPCSA